MSTRLNRSLSVASNAGPDRDRYAPGINLQQLRYLTAVADDSTMRAAAISCHVSQPALSRAIRALEAELGQVLLERRGRNVVLTAIGIEVVEVARRICADTDAIGRIARHHRETLVVCATATFEAMLTAVAVPGFLRRFPFTRLQMVHADSSDDVERRLRVGHARIGLIDRQPSADITAVPMGVGEVVLFSPADAELPDPVPTDLLDSIGLILPSSGSARRADCERLFVALGVSPRVVLESDERSAWTKAVAAGIGSSLGLSWPGMHFSDPHVTIRRFDPPVLAPVHLAYVGDRLSPVAEAFIDAAIHDAASV